MVTNLPSSEVLEFVLESDGLGDSYTILGDLWYGEVTGRVSDRLRGRRGSVPIDRYRVCELTLGPPNACSMMTLRPFGPRVTETALARTSTPANNAVRPWLPNNKSCINACTSQSQFKRSEFDRLSRVSEA